MSTLRTFSRSPTLASRWTRNASRGTTTTTTLASTRSRFGHRLLGSAHTGTGSLSIYSHVALFKFMCDNNFKKWGFQLICLSISGELIEKDSIFAAKSQIEGECISSKPSIFNLSSMFPKKSQEHKIQIRNPKSYIHIQKSPNSCTHTYK